MYMILSAYQKIYIFIQRFNLKILFHVKIIRHNIDDISSHFLYFARSFAFPIRD